LSPDEPGFLATTAIIELVWVLESSYHFKKDESVQVLDNLLRSKELVIERAEIVSQALTVFRSSRADFTDCLIERSGHAAECQYTATFDKRAAAGAGMRMIK
jgi:predicted nucleic-acid-binding protein